MPAQQHPPNDFTTCCSQVLAFFRVCEILLDLPCDRCSPTPSLTYSFTVQVPVPGSKEPSNWQKTLFAAIPSPAAMAGRASLAISVPTLRNQSSVQPFKVQTSQEVTATSSQSQACQAWGQVGMLRLKGISRKTNSDLRFSSMNELGYTLTQIGRASTNGYRTDSNVLHFQCDN